MVSLQHHYLPYLAMQKRGDLKCGEIKRWKESVFPRWNGDAQKRLPEVFSHWVYNDLAPYFVCCTRAYVC